MSVDSSPSTATVSLPPATSSSFPLKPCLLSPLKRKRSFATATLPLAVPETPWREQGSDASNHAVSVSPQSARLVGSFGRLQLEDNLMKDTVIGTPEPVVKRRRRKGKIEENPVPLERDEGIELCIPERLPPSPSPPKLGKQAPKRRLRSPPLPATTPEGDDDEGLVLEDTDSDDADTGEYGIGYRPTPTARWLRDSRRMQQIKEYKIRELREAREKRNRERARRKGASSGAGSHGPLRGPGKGKSVHFNV